MLKFYSIDDLVERRDCSVFRSEDEEYRNYVFSVFKLFRRKLIEGALLDCERISRQVEQILKEAARFHPSPLLVSQLRVMLLELFLKRKNRNRFQEYYRLLRTSLRQLRPEDREVQLVKINSLILYDHDFQVMPHEGEHSSVEAITLHREGRTFQAIELLKHYLNEYGQYVAMKKVLIGKWLLQMSKPEAFEWLYEVLQLQKHEFERYEARVLFVSGYRALTERMGYDLSKCRLKNLNELQKNYTEEMRRLNEQCSLRNIEEFKKEYGMGFDPKLGIIERKTHLSKALDLVAKSHPRQHFSKLTKLYLSTCSFLYWVSYPTTVSMLLSRASSLSKFSNLLAEARHCYNGVSYL